VQPEFEGKTYKNLDETDRIRLDNSIIHSTIVKQESPSDDDTSIFHIFARLNNGGRRLTDQEIRVALYHGSFIEKIKELNKYKHWRDVFGAPSNRLKDQEFILRFFALLFPWRSYTKPMKEFLNRFVDKYRNEDPELLQNWEKRFHETIDVAWQAFGKTAFRPSGTINAAVFDSVMVGLAQRLEKGPINTLDRIRMTYQQLLSDPEYTEAISRATSDEQSVGRRLRKAREAFAEI
jgi:hypothetical protein